MKAIRVRLLSVGLALAMIGCGGGGGGGGTASPAPVSNLPQPPVTPAPSPSPSPSPAPQPIIPTLAVGFQGQELRATIPLLQATAARDLHADAMVYDRQRDQLLVAPSAPAGSATLQGLAPLTLETSWSLPLPAAATTMAIADNGSMLYVGLSDGTVQQYDLTARKLVREIVLTEGRNAGYFPSSLSVRPGSAGTVAISSGSIAPLGFPVFHRLAVWQDGLKWPQTLEVGSVLNNEALQVIFADADTLVSLDVQSSEPIMLRIPVQGQLLAPQFPGISTCCDSKYLQAYNGRILLDRGSIVDPSALRLKVQPYGTGGTFAGLADTGTLVEVSVQKVDGALSPARILLSEYYGDRFNLKRRAFFDTTSLDTAGSYLPGVTRAIDAGHGRVALQVDDIPFHRGARLVVLDTAAVAPVPAPAVVTQSAVAEDVGVLSVTLPLSGMAYDRERDRLVGIIGPEGGPIGNSLVVVRPADGGIEARYALSSQPGSVSVSDTGSVAFVTLPEENGFQRVDVGASGGLRWRVTGLAAPVTGLAIAPDNADTVGIILAHNVGFTVYRGGVLVSQSPEAYMSDIAFNGAREIVVLDQHTTENLLSRYAFDGPAAVLTGTQPKPLWQGFGHAEFRGDTMQDGFSYASLATGQRIGWILQPEGRVLQTATIPEETYEAVSLLDSTRGFATNHSVEKQIEVDYLTAQPGAQGGTTDLIGSRRLQITDTRWPRPPLPGGDYRAIVATGPHSAVLARTIGTYNNTTLYFIKGL